MSKAIEIKFHVGDEIYQWDESKRNIERVKICRIEINPTSVNYYGNDGTRYSDIDVDTYSEDPNKCLEKIIKKMDKILKSNIKHQQDYCKNEIESMKENHLKDIQKLKKNVQVMLSKK